MSTFSSAQQAILSEIEPATKLYDVPIPLIAAIIEVESSFNPHALGDNGSSIGLFQLHKGGQADKPIAEGHPFESLAEPLLNTRYAMPAIASAWDDLKGNFNASNFGWWLDFASRSGHPGGNADTPATINEAHKLQAAYETFATLSAQPVEKEVAAFIDVSQFIPGKSAYECVAYSVALAKFAGQHGPTGTVLEASNLAQFWYGKETGSTSPANHAGMSVTQEHAMLDGVALHYHDLPITGNTAHDVTYIKAWLALGYPVLICGAETGMFDSGLGDHVPYSWTPTGNHCIVASGIASNGNLLVHDCANVDASGKVRQGPRTYDANKLSLISATAVIEPWLATPATDFDPTVKQVELPEDWVKAGWKWVNGALVAPNRITVAEPFATYMIEHKWDATDIPLIPILTLSSLEEANSSIGPGKQLICTRLVLEVPDKTGVVQEMYCGKNLLSLRQKVAQLYAALKQPIGVTK